LSCGSKLYKYFIEKYKDNKREKYTCREVLIVEPGLMGFGLKQNYILLHSMSFDTARRDCALVGFGNDYHWKFVMGLIVTAASHAVPPVPGGSWG